MTRRFTVAHLTTVHRPLDSRIFYREARTLAKAGYRVLLIVPHDRREVVDGVEIIPLRRPKSRLRRYWATQWQLYREALKNPADLYHFHDPEILPLGMLLRLHGKKVVYDSHEDLPRDIHSKAWIPRPLRWLVSLAAEMLERVSMPILSGFVAATPVIGRRFPAKKTVVVNNFPPADELLAEDALPYAQREAVVLYMGDLAEVRGGLELVQCMGQIPDALKPRLVILGAFTSERLERQVRQLPGWERIEFRGWCDWDGVRAALGQARLGIVLYHPGPNYVEAQPRKLFEYMAAGLPVVASDFPLWREFLGNGECGLTVDPLDPSAAAGAIQWLLEHPEKAEQMGAKGRQKVLESYCWEKEAVKLLGFYDQLLNDLRARTAAEGAVQ